MFTFKKLACTALALACVPSWVSAQVTVTSSYTSQCTLTWVNFASLPYGPVPTGFVQVLNSSGNNGPALFSNVSCLPSSSYYGVEEVRDYGLMCVSGNVQPGTWVTLLTGHMGDRS